MLFLLDTNALCHSMYHISEAGDTADIVERILNRLERLKTWANDIEPATMLAIFDGRHMTFRRKILPTYKANRIYDEATTAGILEVIAHTKEAIGFSDDWTELTSPYGFEADDLIASIAHQSNQLCVIHSADKDLNQCLSQRVQIAKRSGVIETGEGPLAGMLTEFRVELFTVEDLAAKFGLTPDQWVDYQCLVGDTADNVPGAKWVGDKTARMILAAGEIEDTDTALLKRRQCEGWPGFLSRLDDLRQVFSLSKDLDLDEYQRHVPIKLHQSERPKESYGHGGDEPH